MAFMIPLYVGFIWTSLVSALVILSPQPVLNPSVEPNSVSESSRNISTLIEANASLLSLPSGGVLSNTSHLNFSGPPYIFCDKALGEDFNVGICENALAHATLGHDAHLRTWGPRDANRFDIGLPRLYMSSDGRCGVQAVLRDGATSATVEPSVALHAADLIVRDCVRGNPSTGGFAESVGGDNKLLMYVQEYDPFIYADDVECLGATSRGPGIVNGCNRLADIMPASNEREEFGPRSLSPDYQTPYRISPPNNPCYVEVTSHPDNRHLITGTWAEIWQGVIFVNAICIRAGRQGRIRLTSFDEDDEWLEVMVGDSSALGNNLTLSLTTE
ncbi:hypothetical protein BDR22DRAFT_885071 [Usnea florida]